MLMIASFASSPALAQDSSSRNIKRGVTAVLFSTLGGAVLGLSTLPFYGEPHEHTNNINVGAVIGFVAGVGYVTYRSNQPAPRSFENDYGFSETLKMKKAFAVSAKAPFIQVQFEF